MQWIRALPQFFSSDVDIRALDRCDKVASELRHEPEDECTLLWWHDMWLEKGEESRREGQTWFLSP
jgi:hypothetical protein